MAGRKDYEVTIVNPTSNPRKRRRRRRTTTTAPAPRRRRRHSRRRRSNPGEPPARRGRRSGGYRRNPSILGLNFSIGKVAGDAALRMLGKVVGAWAVRMIGTAETNQIDGGVSPTTGMRWSFWNHFVCIGAGILAGGVLANVLKGRPAVAEKVFEGAVDLSATKAFWSEIVQRVPSGPKYLGASDEGDVKEFSDGRTYIRQGGKWVSMMGLEDKTALDGLEYATALGRRRERRRSMGHLLPPEFRNTDTDSTGRYTGTASADPYAAAYQQ